MNAGPVTVDVGARTTAGAAVTLTVLANGNLTSGTDVITINNLTWTRHGDRVRRRNIERHDGAERRRVDRIGSADRLAVVLAAEQLGVRARQLHGYAQLHADRSLVGSEFSRKRPRRSGTSMVPFRRRSLKATLVITVPLHHAGAGQIRTTPCRSSCWLWPWRHRLVARSLRVERQP